MKKVCSAGGIGNKLKAGILFNPIASANRAAGTAFLKFLRALPILCMNKRQDSQKHW